MTQTNKIYKALFFIVIGLLVSAFSSQQPKSFAQEDNHDHTHAQEGELLVNFLDVGQGDATFITFPDGTNMLIDCAKDKRVLPKLGEILPFSDRSIDFLVITHPDSDHYGGCIDVLKRYEIGEIVYTGKQKKGSFFETFQREVEQEQGEGAVYTEIKARDSWEIAGVRVSYLFPDFDIESDMSLFDKELSSNNTSIVMMLSFGETDILLTGDAEKEIEKYLIQTYGTALDVEILKLGHHGSKSSSIQDFLDITTPDVGIASAGQGNQYNHPAKDIVNRVLKNDIELYRTDRDGNIIIIVDDEGYQVSKEVY